MATTVHTTTDIGIRLGPDIAKKEVHLTSQSPVPSRLGSARRATDRRDYRIIASTNLPSFVGRSKALDPSESTSQDENCRAASNTPDIHVQGSGSVSVYVRTK